MPLGSPPLSLRFWKYPAVLKTWGNRGVSGVVNLGIPGRQHERHICLIPTEYISMYLIWMSFRKHLLRDWVP